MGGTGGGTPSDLLMIITSAIILLNIACTTCCGIFFLVIISSRSLRPSLSRGMNSAWPLRLICTTGGKEAIANEKGIISTSFLLNGGDEGTWRFI